VLEHRRRKDRAIRRSLRKDEYFEAGCPTRKPTRRLPGILNVGGQMIRLVPGALLGIVTVIFAESEESDSIGLRR